jgi:hypothetical protein
MISIILVNCTWDWDLLSRFIAKNAACNLVIVGFLAELYDVVLRDLLNGETVEMPITAALSCQRKHRARLITSVAIDP